MRQRRPAHGDVDEGRRRTGHAGQIRQGGVIRIGARTARNVLVLEPGTSAGAAYFVPLARWIVSRRPGWQKLVALITSASVIIYAARCLSLAAMRRQLPHQRRPFRLAGAALLVPVGFVISNLIVLFAGWTTDWKLFRRSASGWSCWPSPG